MKEVRVFEIEYECENCHTRYIDSELIYKCDFCDTVEMCNNCENEVSDFVSNEHFDSTIFHNYNIYHVCDSCRKKIVKKVSELKTIWRDWIEEETGKEELE